MDCDHSDQGWSMTEKFIMIILKLCIKQCIIQVASYVASYALFIPKVVIYVALYNGTLCSHIYKVIKLWSM